MGNLYITLDTEMDADPHWRKTIVPQFTSILKGIPLYLRPIWDKYEVNPIYFVSPEVAASKECCKILKQEVQKGAIIGAHLHPEYIEPEKKGYVEGSAAEFPCYAYNREIEKQKLENLLDLIEKNIGVRPVWYRAARYGADIDTISILKELGMKYDSSVTPQIDWTSKGGPDHSKASVRKYYISDDNYYKKSNTHEGIIEFPITILGKRWGFIGRLLPDNWLFYRWLRPTHMTYLEQKSIIRTMKKSNVKDIVMMFHTMEIMVNKTPFVRNKLMQKYFLWRLRKTIEFAKKESYSPKIAMKG